MRRSGFSLGLLGILLWTATLQGKGVLVTVFCSELIYQTQKGNPLESDAQWAAFVARLESETPRSEVDPAVLHDCIHTNQDEMERGQFLLDGKKMLEQLATRSLLHRPSQEDPGRSLASVTLPGFGEISLTSSTRRSGLLSSDSVLRRTSQYEDLWTTFLENLRKTMTLRRQALKIGLKGR